MSKHERTPPNQGDFTGRAQGGGRGELAQGHSGWESPSAQGGQRYGRTGDALREIAYIMEEPTMVRARGRAPKNYRRSDQRIREDICDRLTMHDRIDSSDVSVEVRDGIVILEGTVPERRMRYMIEDLAAECLGANDVDNRIRVARADEQAPGAGTAAPVGASSSTSEMGNVTGVSGTTGRPAPPNTPPAGPREENLTGPTDRIPAR